MSDVMTISKRNAAGLEEVLRTLLLDSENKVPADRLRIVGALAEGAILEQGSNANGNYVRFADGTQICMSTIKLTDIDIAEKQEVWNARSYTPPAAFVGTSYVSVVYAEGTNNSISIYLAPSFYDGVMQVWNTGRSPSNVHPGDAVRGTGSSQIYNVTSAIIRVVAIGRWKA